MKYQHLSTLVIIFTFFGIMAGALLVYWFDVAAATSSQEVDVLSYVSNGLHHKRHSNETQQWIPAIMNHYFVCKRAYSEYGWSFTITRQVCMGKDWILLEQQLGKILDSSTACLAWKYIFMNYDFSSRLWEYSPGRVLAQGTDCPAGGNNVLASLFGSLNNKSIFAEQQSYQHNLLWNTSISIISDPHDAKLWELATELSMLTSKKLYPYYDELRGNQTVLALLSPKENYPLSEHTSTYEFIELPIGSSGGWLQHLVSTSIILDDFHVRVAPLVPITTALQYSFKNDTRVTAFRIKENECFSHFFDIVECDTNMSSSLVKFLRYNGCKKNGRLLNVCPPFGTMEKYGFVSLKRHLAMAEWTRIYGPVWVQFIVYDDYITHDINFIYSPRQSHPLGVRFGIIIGYDITLESESYWLIIDSISGKMIKLAINSNLLLVETFALGQRLDVEP